MADRADGLPRAGKIPPRGRIHSEIFVRRQHHGFDVLVQIRKLDFAVTDLVHLLQPIMPQDKLLRPPKVWVKECANAVAVAHMLLALKQAGWDPVALIALIEAMDVGPTPEEGAQP